MTPEEIRTTLAEAEIFGALPERIRDELAPHFRAIEVARGEYVFFEGDRSERIYLAVSGRIKVVRHSSEGKEVLIEVVPAGHPFALLSGLERHPLSASAIAMEDCALLFIDSDHFLQLLQDHPELSLSVIHDLVGRLRDARDRIRSLALERVEQRIARVLLALANSLGRRIEGRVILDLALTRQDIASMVGTTVESAIRTMSKFQKDGLLHTAPGGRIEIMDIEALKRIAELEPGKRRRGRFAGRKKDKNELMRAILVGVISAEGAFYPSLGRQPQVEWAKKMFRAEGPFYYTNRTRGVR